jgi:hypothetical protein
MNNSQTALFFLDIGEATYSDLDCLKKLLHGIENPVDYWSLIQPDHLRQIISNAKQRLLNICWQFMTEMFDDFVEIRVRPTAIQFEPSADMMWKVQRFIDGDINLIGKEVSHYEYSYQLFINSKQKYENCLIQVHGSHISLSSVVFSLKTPVSEVQSLVALTLAQQDFEKRNQQLNQHFAEILQKTAIYLEGMEERTIQAISRYIDQLECNEF